MEMNKRKRVKTRQTYHWRNLSNGCNHKPNDTLVKRKNVNELKDDGQQELLSHLSPEEFGQPKCATMIKAQAKQANEHDEK
jgi:hypothetical protein